MTKLDRWIAKPHKFMLWAFTGLIVVSTAFTLFQPYSTIKDKKKSNVQKTKKEKQPKTAEEIERDSRDVGTWSRKELFDYLTRVSIKDCVKCVESI